MSAQAEPSRESIVPMTPQQEQMIRAQKALMDAREKGVQFVRENPAACIVGGLAVGYLLGRLARSRWLR